MTVEAEGRDSAIGDRVTEVVAAYVSNNHVAPGDLPALIASVRASLAEMANGPQETAVEPTAKLTPAQIRKSITPDALISFIDGKPYKTLKRHLSRHGMDPDGYRARYGLSADYPMVASSYSERRSALARSVGLGNRKRGADKEGA